MNGVQNSEGGYHTLTISSQTTNGCISSLGRMLVRVYDKNLSDSERDHLLLLSAPDKMKGSNQFNLGVTGNVLVVNHRANPALPWAFSLVVSAPNPQLAELIIEEFRMHESECTFLARHILTSRDPDL